MAGTYHITTEPARHLVRIVLGGFFEPDDVTAFGLALRDACAALPCAPNAHLTLMDCAALHIQTQAAVAAFAAVAQDPVVRSRRAAVVVGKSLVHAQARRVYQHKRDNLGFFRDREKAEAWLLAAGVSAAQTASRYRHVPVSPRSADHGCTVPNGA